MVDARGNDYDAVVIGGGPSDSLTDTDRSFRSVDLEAIGDGYTTWSLQIEKGSFRHDSPRPTSEFDATVLEEARVIQLVFSGERVAGVQYKQYDATAQFVVDAVDVLASSLEV